MLRAATCLFVVCLVGCSAAEPAPDAGSASLADAGGVTRSDAGIDGGVVPSGDAGAAVDAGSSGLLCSFNTDCPEAERCACDEVAGCTCERGPRGTGVLGVDTCTSGDDCESSLCLEGPGDVLYCSGPCDDDADCGGVLPVCADIAFVGRICIRAAP